MRFFRSLICAMLPVALLFGCQALPVAAPAFVLSAPAQAQAQARVLVALGGAYGLQALVAPIDASRLATIRLTLFAKGNGQFQSTGVSVDVPAAELNKPVTLSQLKINTAYRIEAEAFDQDGVSLSVKHNATNAVTFTTPAVLKSAGDLETLDNAVTPILTIQLQLDEVSYPGFLQGTVIVPPVGFAGKPVEEVEVILSRRESSTANWSQVVSKRFSDLESRSISFAFQNLKLDTFYKVSAVGYSSDFPMGVAYGEMPLSTPKAVPGTAIEDTIAVAFLMGAQKVPMPSGANLVTANDGPGVAKAGVTSSSEPQPAIEEVTAAVGQTPASGPQEGAE